MRDKLLSQTKINNMSSSSSSSSSSSQPVPSTSATPDRTNDSTTKTTTTDGKTDRHSNPLIRPHLVNNGVRKCWQYNKYSDRFELLSNGPISVRLGRDNTVKGIKGDQMTIRAVHDNGLCESEPLRNCGWHHNEQNSRAVFHTFLDGYKGSKSVSWDGHHAVRVDMEGACEVSLLFVCHSSELQNGGNKEGNRRWILQLRGTFLGERLTVNLRIQVFTLLRPVTRLRKLMARHEKETTSDDGPSGGKRDEFKTVAALRDEYVRLVDRTTRERANAIHCRETLLEMIKQAASRARERNMQQDDDDDDDD